MKVGSLAAAAALLASSVSASLWSSRGPVGGPAKALVAASSNRHVFYAGNAAGIFRSDDDAATWTNVGESLSNLSVVNGSDPGSVYETPVIAVDPSNAHVLYVGGHDAIYKTTNGGETWDRLSSGLPTPIRPSAIVIDPRNPNTVYLGSHCGGFGFTGPRSNTYQGAGVFKSTDGGRTWTPAMAGMVEFQICVEELTLDPGNPDRLYSAPIFNDYGSARSDDGARTWYRAPSALPGRAVVVDPRDNRKRYGITSRGSGLFLVSNDGGVTWSEIKIKQSTLLGPFGLPGLYEALTIDPQSGRLFLGTSSGVHRSGDGGVTWLPLDGPARDHITSVIFDPDTNALTIGSNTGVYRSDTFPWGDWKYTSLPGVATEVAQIAVDRSAPGVLCAFGSGWLFRTRDFGQSWELIAQRLPFPPIDESVPTARGLAANGGDVYAIVDTTIRPSMVYKLATGSQQWEVVDVPPPLTHDPLSDDLTFVTIDPHVPATLYVGRYNEVEKTRDDGKTWEHLPLPGGPLTVMLIDPRNANVIYVSIGGVSAHGLWKSVDGGKTWAQKAPYFAYGYPSLTVMSQADPSTLYLITYDLHLGHVLARTIDGGDTWTTLPEPLTDVNNSETFYDITYAIAADPRDHLVLYAGTGNHGVLRSSDGGVTWQSIADGLPQSTITWLKLDAAGAFLHAGTADRGVWELHLQPRGRPSRHP